MKVTLIQQTKDIVKTVADIASICYGNEEAKNPEGLVKHLYNNGHHSVFEHIYFTWKIEGISRAASHQLVRHRMASFTQKSQRHCEDFDIVVPKSILNNKLALMKYNTMSFEIAQMYDYLKEKNIPKEDARFILPNATTTDIYMSCNLREFIHICNERLCTRAQWEIREMVKKMVKTLPEEIQWMCQPKCKSGFIICHEECQKERTHE